MEERGGKERSWKKGRKREELEERGGKVIHGGKERGWRKGEEAVGKIGKGRKRWERKGRKLKKG